MKLVAKSNRNESVNESLGVVNYDSLENRSLVYYDGHKRATAPPAVKMN